MSKCVFMFIKITFYFWASQEVLKGPGSLSSQGPTLCCCLDPTSVRTSKFTPAVAGSSRAIPGNV